ncbi:hypothetical protein ACFV9C_07065 [Kribbella sp. NPDC059898]|uniref:hypothetical protein n=1 Tax=Kribbella sp. NPDC059898 TaxID=3346995 RepID=UPI0036605780
MRLIHRRSAALFVVAFLFALSAPAALAAVPERPVAATADEPVIPDTPVFAEPAAQPVTLTKGSSSVTVSRTADLSRQMLTVSWTGMTPSTGDTNQTSFGFPVVVMQCRGNDPDRSDCWMASPVLGGALSPILGTAYLPPETSQWRTSNPAVPYALWNIPFRKADGTYHAIPRAGWTDRWTVPGLGGKVTGSSVDDYTPGTANQRLGITRQNGTGEVQTWANTAAENPNLGCSQGTACSLVVVPITRHPCRSTSVISAAEATRCAGLATGGNDVTGSNWALLANWYQRYVFKLSFAPAATTCEGRSDSAGFLGSELMAEAMRRWLPARCQTSSPVGLDYTRGWEPDSRRQFGQSDPVAPSGYEADAVVVSEPSSADDPAAARKPAYAPIGISGFAIGYNWERSETVGGGLVPDIKLNQRLVAKLLTQSYPGAYRVDKYGLPVNPNAPTNPQNLLSDPEFVQLNPEAPNWAGLSDAVGTQIALPVANTDVMLALTRWIWSDPSARAFLQGKSDPWGMTVNKTYRSWPMPRSDYELNDGWVLPNVPGVGAGWAGQSPQELGAQTIDSWARGADAAMTGWPLNQGAGPGPNNVGTQIKRVDAQQAGFRHMLILSTTSEVEKAGLRYAALQNTQGAFVKPSTESLTYGIDGATVDKDSGMWRPDLTKMDIRGYPGTMISYAEVPTTSLKGDEPKRYADTLRWMTTEGQVYGSDPGNLPDGYLALTEPMQAQAAKVADAVQAQNGTPPPPPTQNPVPNKPNPTSTPTTNAPGGGPNTTGSSTGNNGNGNGANGNNNGGNTNTGTTPNPTGSPSAGPNTPGATPSTGSPSDKPQAQGSIKPVSATTQGDSLGWLSWGIPAFLIAGLVAGVASPGIRLIATPGHPVRRGVVAGATYLSGLFRRGRRRNS